MLEPTRPAQYTPLRVCVCECVCMHACVRESFHLFCVSFLSLLLSGSSEKCQCVLLSKSLSISWNTEGYAVIHTAIDKASGALEPLLSLLISVAISDTLVCFTLSFSVSLSPLLLSLSSLYLLRYPCSSFFSLSLFCVPLYLSFSSSALHDYQLLVANFPHMQPFSSSCSRNEIKVLVFSALATVPLTLV